MPAHIIMVDPSFGAADKLLVIADRKVTLVEHECVWHKCHRPQTSGYSGGFPPRGGFPASIVEHMRDRAIKELVK